MIQPNCLWCQAGINRKLRGGLSSRIVNVIGQPLHPHASAAGAQGRGSTEHPAPPSTTARGSTRRTARSRWDSRSANPSISRPIKMKTSQLDQSLIGVFPPIFSKRGHEACQRALTFLFRHTLDAVCRSMGFKITNQQPSCAPRAYNCDSRCGAGLLHFRPDIL